MENASKALIIAGAILLAILIISLGILIFSQAQDTVGSVNMSEQEMMAFNNKFTSYGGSNKRGTEVNALIQAVRANNQSAVTEGAKEKVVEIKAGTGITDTVSTDTTETSTTFGAVTGTVTKGNAYKITIGYKNGLVNTITIDKNN